MKPFQIVVLAAAALSLTTCAAAEETAPSRPLTGLEVAKRCRAAYSALHTYQVTSAVTIRTVEDPSGKVENERASAVTQYARPGKIHVEGLDTEAKPFAFVSDGLTTVQTDAPKQGPWKKVLSDDNVYGVEAAVRLVTGSAMNAATTIPALLLSTDSSVVYHGWGTPTPLKKDFLSLAGDPASPIGKPSSLVVKEGKIGAVTYFILIPDRSIVFDKEAYWIDKKTFLLRRIVTDSDPATDPIPAFAVREQDSLTLKTHEEEDLIEERINQPIPDSTFALPAADPKEPSAR